ncbi:MAG TPA: AAA family ATPase [Solirubrobacterales bacterium]|nr:AAA family ATPase [Solirubrobacterales bacterium]
MIYTFANCELDTDLFELRCEGALQGVEPQVFEVLAYLIAHRDRVVTRDELLAQVWGHTYVSDAALSSRLRDARRAVGDSGRSQSLIRTIRGRGYRFVGEVRERAATDSAAPSRRSSRAPLLAGRQAERARLDELADAALGGSRQLVIVTGEAGIGKTTLIEGFLAHAGGAGDLLVGRGRCADQRGAAEPYMPVLEALTELGSGPGRVEVVETLARVGPTWLAQLPSLADDTVLADAGQRAVGARPERMLREMGQALASLAAERPVVLVLDDLHWSDDSTLQLLTHLARADDPARLLILAASRPTEGPSLNALLRELRPRGRCVELPLSLLGEEAISEYVDQRWPGPDRDRLAAALHARTDGNPLFIDCLAGSWIESGLLREEDGGWRLRVDSPRLAEVPDTLRELIVQDVERLEPEERSLLDAASALGLAFSAGIVAPAASTPAEDAEVRLAALARHGRIVEWREPVAWPDGTISATFAFIHDLYRQVLYESLPAGLRARIHRDLMARLEAAYGARAGEHSAELAGHALSGGDANAAARHLELAAEQAGSRGALHEAATHLARALELIERGSVTADPQRRELSLRAGRAGVLVALEGYSSADAEASYRRALELARAVGDRDFEAILLYRLGGLHEFRGEYTTSAALLAEALEINQDPEPARFVETHELMACSLFHQGSFDPAVGHAETALAHYGPEQRYPDAAFEGEHPAVACHDWAGLAQWCLGDSDQALARIESALAMASREGHVHGQASARLFAAQLHHLRREPEQARRHAELALAVASDRRVAYQMAVARILLGWSLSALGETAEGLELIRAGLESHAATGARMDRPYYLGLMADALIAARRPKEAIDVAEDALGLVAADRPFFYEPELHRLRAVAVLEARGQEAVADAEASLRRGLAIAQARGARGLALRVAVTLAIVLRDLGSSAQALDVLRQSSAGFAAEADGSDLRCARELITELTAAER